MMARFSQMELWVPLCSRHAGGLLPLHAASLPAGAGLSRVPMAQSRREAVISPHNNRSCFRFSLWH
jgi:hypothetical protein